MKAIQAILTIIIGSMMSEKNKSSRRTHEELVASNEDWIFGWLCYLLNDERLQSPGAFKGKVTFYCGPLFPKYSGDQGQYLHIEWQGDHAMIIPIAFNNQASERG